MNLSAHLIPIEAVIASGRLFTYSRQSLFVMYVSKWPLPATIGEERKIEREKHEMDVADKEVWLR